jgi:hypothetical protein
VKVKNYVHNKDPLELFKFRRYKVYNSERKWRYKIAASYRHYSGEYFHNYWRYCTHYCLRYSTSREIIIYQFVNYNPQFYGTSKMYCSISKGPPLYLMQNHTNLFYDFRLYSLKITSHIRLISDWFNFSFEGKLFVIKYVTHLGKINYCLSYSPKWLIIPDDSS